MGTKFWPIDIKVGRNLAFRLRVFAFCCCQVVIFAHKREDKNCLTCSMDQHKHVIDTVTKLNPRFWVSVSRFGVLGSGLKDLGSGFKFLG